MVPRVKGMVEGMEGARAHGAARIDLFLGMAIFSVAGALIGYYLDHLVITFAGVVLGGILGVFVATLGARCFFLSVLTGTLLCGVLGWS